MARNYALSTKYFINEAVSTNYSATNISFINETAAITPPVPPAPANKPPVAPGGPRIRHRKDWPQEKPYHIPWDELEKQRKAEFDKRISDAIDPPPPEEIKVAVKPEKVIKVAPPENHELEIAMLLST